MNRDPIEPTFVYIRPSNGQEGHWLDGKKPDPKQHLPKSVRAQAQIKKQLNFKKHG